MNVGKTVFSQLIELYPEYAYKKKETQQELTLRMPTKIEIGGSILIWLKS
ncbi:MAG: hypothetical protein GY786_18860 [Proteobacteria bacterium]|nr:hypothetical protein [Pseudomonadota bacterium]